jgi:hypothetical protein
VQTGRADDRHLIGNGQTHLPRQAHGAQGEEIARRVNPPRRAVTRDVLAQALVPGRFLVAVAVDEIDIARGHAGFDEALEKAEEFDRSRAAGAEAVGEDRVIDPLFRRNIARWRGR